MRQAFGRDGGATRVRERGALTAGLAFEVQGKQGKRAPPLQATEGGMTEGEIPRRPQDGLAPFTTALRTGGMTIVGEGAEERFPAGTSGAGLILARPGFGMTIGGEGAGKERSLPAGPESSIVGRRTASPATAGRLGMTVVREGACRRG